VLAGSPAAVLITDAAVFDGSDWLRPAMNVLVAEGRIAQISGQPIAPPPECEVVDVAGRTLMPGLIDAHVHPWLADLDLAKATQRPDPYVAAFAFATLGRMLERGFTTVRDAGGMDVGYTLALEAGLVRGPRLLHTGRIISQTGGHFDVRTAERFAPLCGCGRAAEGASRFAAIVDGTDEMVRAVREELRKGAGQVKLMASGGVASPTDPLDRMQFSDAEIRAAVEEADRRGAYVMAHCHPASSIERCARLGVRSIEHGSFMNDEAAQAVAEAGAYVVPTMATVWALLEDGQRQGLPAASQRKAESLAEGVLQGLHTMRRHGLRLGFGTDVLGPQQDRQATEFALRSQIFPAREILRSATAVNAEILRIDDRLGRIAEGFVADLVIQSGAIVKRSSRL